MQARETAVPEQGEVKAVDVLVDAYHHLLDSGEEIDGGAAGWILLAARARVISEQMRSR
jgi:hypothetical protein